MREGSSRIKTIGKYLRPATSHRQQNGLKPDSRARHELRITAFGHWCSVGRVSYTRWPWKERRIMYQRLTERLREALAGHIREKYGLELAIALERPPKIEMGEAASPVCFELAKRLKKAPRMIAQEIANGLGK